MSAAPAFRDRWHAPIDIGMTTGVCWPGADDGLGGGCSTSSGAPGAAISSGLLFALLVFTRRRRT